MPLKPGYSRATFQTNLSELIRSGHDRDAAIMAAASMARKSFFARFPKGALPLWLAFPKTHRLKHEYDANGKPLMSPPSTTRPTASDGSLYAPNGARRNPVISRPNPAALAKASALYEGFTGVAPRKLRKLYIPKPPKEALAIGKIFGIMYSVDATGERFHHEFKGKARPLLVVSPDGRQVFMHGGAYTFTKRGFVDRKN